MRSDSYFDAHKLPVLPPPNVRRERHTTAPQTSTKRANVSRRCVSARRKG